jgi:hypothetical protein
MGYILDTNENIELLAEHPADTSRIQRSWTDIEHEFNINMGSAIAYANLLTGIDDPSQLPEDSLVNTGMNLHELLVDIEREFKEMRNLVSKIKE